jgi:hypothetical protein
MFDAVSAGSRRDHRAPQPPTWASLFFAFAARLGTFLLASVLGTVWVFTLFVGLVVDSPNSPPALGGLWPLGWCSPSW